MKKLLLFGMLMSLLMPVLAMAQSAFDGTWKMELNKAQLPKKPDVFLLQDGIYHCKTCVPPIDVKANGQDQKVTGQPYFDTVAIKVVDDRTIQEIDKKNGKIVITSKTTVSPDGTKASFEFTDGSNTNAAPVTGKGESARVAKGPAGSPCDFGLLANHQAGELLGERACVHLQGGRRQLDHDHSDRTNLYGET